MRLDPLPPRARERLAAVLQTRDAELDLCEAAFLAGASGRPTLDPEPIRSELNRLASLLRECLPFDPADAAAAPDAAHPSDGAPDGAFDLLFFRALRDFMGGEMEYRLATREERRDVRLLQLDQVVARRVALPVTLAAIELELARLIGVRVDPVDVTRQTFIAGRSGLILDVETGLIGSRAELEPATDEEGQLMLPEQSLVGRRLIVGRLFRALQRRWTAEREWASVLGIVELFDVLMPGHTEYHRDRGLLLGRMGAYTEAAAELTTYLETDPTSRDADSVRRALSILRSTRN